MFRFFKIKDNPRSISLFNEKIKSEPLTLIKDSLSDNLALSALTAIAELTPPCNKSNDLTCFANNKISIGNGNSTLLYLDK